MEKILQILAAALLIAAAYFLLRGVTDWSFVCGVLAACSFFVSMRFQIKARVAELTETENEDDDDHPSTERGLEEHVNTGEKSPENTTLQS